MITAAILATFVSAVSYGAEASTLSVVQILWICFIMDTISAFAISTDPPDRLTMDRNPEPKPAPLVTAYMWKMILGQAIYQISITLILYFAGKRIFHSIEEIRDELTFLRIVRGGHLNQLKYHRRNLRETISDIFERTPRGGSVMRPRIVGGTGPVHEPAVMLALQ
jgi:magnesium-transporting ATPase (P-type)